MRHNMKTTTPFVIALAAATLCWMGTVLGQKAKPSGKDDFPESDELQRSYQLVNISGNVTATIERLDRRGVLVRQVSGAIELRFADALNADVVASDVDGDIRLDLPDVSRESRPVRTMLRARVGTGGWPISITKVSGKVRLVGAG